MREKNLDFDLFYGLKNQNIFNIVSSYHIHSLMRVDEMNEIIKSFGNNAGKVWTTLKEEGPQVQTKLIKKTNMRNDEFYGAIGWLAREGKITAKVTVKKK